MKVVILGVRITEDITTTAGETFKQMLIEIKVAIVMSTVGCIIMWLLVLIVVPVI